jgi:MarR family transcriptional regulator, transcriptional regulator for hemolysin
MKSLAILTASHDNISMLMITQDYLSFLLHDVSRSFRARFDEQARHLGVTRPQWRALLHLSIEEGQSQAELADRLEVERITLCRMIDRLADAGLVVRRADPRDRRVWRLHLTEGAGQLVDKLSTIGRALEEEAMAALEPGEAEMLKTGLRKIRAAFADGRGQRVAA